MIIEAGKYYKTRDGRKVGPMREFDCDGFLSTEIDGEIRVFIVAGGKHNFGITDLDLIAEWTDEQSPVVTETVKRIVPGVYGRVEVTGTYNGNRVTLDWSGNESIHSAVAVVGLDPEELRAASHVLLQLADALEESK